MTAMAKRITIIERRSDGPTLERISKAQNHFHIGDDKQGGRLLSNYPEIAKAKLVFPGATIMRVSRSVEDPLKAISDTNLPIDGDEIGF